MLRQCNFNSASAQLGCASCTDQRFFSLSTFAGGRREKEMCTCKRFKNYTLRRLRKKIEKVKTEFVRAEIFGVDRWGKGARLLLVEAQDSLTNTAINPMFTSQPAVGLLHPTTFCQLFASSSVLLSFLYVCYHRYTFYSFLFTSIVLLLPY